MRALSSALCCSSRLASTTQHRCAGVVSLQRCAPHLQIRFSDAESFLYQACRFYWSDYTSSNDFTVGGAPVNATFVLSILCGIAAGVVQGNVEGKIRKALPGRFPPDPAEALKAVYAKWKAGDSITHSVGGTRAKRPRTLLPSHSPSPESHPLASRCLCPSVTCLPLPLLESADTLPLLTLTRHLPLL